MMPGRIHQGLRWFLSQAQKAKQPAISPRAASPYQGNDFTARPLPPRGRPGSGIAACGQGVDEEVVGALPSIAPGDRAAELAAAGALVGPIEQVAEGGEE